MRTAVTLVLLALLSTAPLAAASPSARVDVHGPASPVANSGEPVTILIEVGLMLQEFTCLHETPFAVTLSVNAPADVQATLENDTVTFMVPGESYFAEPYRGLSSVLLTLTAPMGDASVDVIATFYAPADACLAPGGFPASGATTTVRLVSATPSEPAPDATPTPATPSPSETTPSDEDASTTSGENRTSTPPTSYDARAAPGSGYIGEYSDEGVTESATVPGAATILVLAVIAGAALVARRKL